MRVRTLFLVVLVTWMGGTLFSADVTAADKKTTPDKVKEFCGEDLQSGGSAFGCTKCRPGKGPFKGGCIDYSCNYSGKGRQGCWKMVFKTVPPSGGKDTKVGSNSVTGVNTAGTGIKRLKSVNRHSVISPTSGGFGTGWKNKSIGGSYRFKPSVAGGFIRRK